MDIDNFFKGTKGEWSVPHLSDKSTSCNCGFILSEGYAGAVATVNWSPDRDLANGDNPPMEEAYYNGRLLGNAKLLLQQCDTLASYLTDALNIMTCYTGLDDKEYEEFSNVVGETYALINNICDYEQPETTVEKPNN